MDAVYADAGEAQIVPAGVKDLRACTSCNLVKTAHQWQQDGCENCGWTDGWQDATTNRFHGSVLGAQVFVAVFDLVCTHSMIAMMSHERSWVYKWQRMKPTYRPGCYAVKVDGYVNVTQQDDDMGLGGDDDAQ